MVFISGHFTSEDQFLQIAQNLKLSLDEILFCGSTDFNPQLNNRVPYHPLYQVTGEVQVKDRHAYLDTLLRALQIESPMKILYFNASKFDHEIVLNMTKRHCEIIDIIVNNIS
jgi:hypothetical protein